MAWCDRLDAAGCEAVVDAWTAAAAACSATAPAHVLLQQHVFMHQTHHRGQAHAMLSSTAVAPPQLDEFLMPSEAHLRAAEMRALGWSEATLFS